MLFLIIFHIFSIIVRFLTNWKGVHGNIKFSAKSSNFWIKMKLPVSKIDILTNNFWNKNAKKCKKKI